MTQEPMNKGWAGDQILLVLVMPVWFEGVAITISDLLRMAKPEGADLLPFIAAGLFGLIGPFVAVALLAQRRPGWRPSANVAAALVVLSGYLLLDLLLRLVPTDNPTVLAAIRLGLLALYVPAAAVLARKLVGLGSLRLTTMLGLDRLNLSALAVGLAATAIVTIPWPYTGALGDRLTSVEQVLHSLTLVLPSLLLVWGLTYGLLRQALARSWLAALGAMVAYLLVFVPDHMLSLDRDLILRDAVILIPLVLLLAELRARDSGIYPLLPLAWAGHAIPVLFVDPRDVIAREGLPELTHVFSYVGALALALALGFALWAGRKFFRYLQRQQEPPLLPVGILVGLALVAAAMAFVAWGSVYVVAGEPGFADDGFLIILAEQADLNGAETISDREARIQYVYDTLVETAERTQASLWAELQSMGVPYRPYYVQNMVRVEGHRWLMSRFEGRPGVAQVILNPNVRRYPRLIPIDIPVDYGYGPSGQLPENLTAIRVHEAWNLGVTGQGIVVAGQDTGYDWAHPALIGHYRGWDGHVANHDYNWHDAWEGSLAPSDEDSHGTHTMGTILGDDGALEHTGVAPGAQWIGCRNMRRGIGNPASYVECMEFFLAPYPIGGDPFSDGVAAMAPHVINNSWGCPDIEGCAPGTLEDAVKALRAAGIMMVVSAGNEGPGCASVTIPPANYDAVFSVGATRLNGPIAPFSSRGPVDGRIKPDVVAPGLEIRSSIPGGGYGYADGTSMAGPHVTGLVALIWSANPSFIGQIDQTEALICRTAVPKSVDNLCLPNRQPPNEDFQSMFSGPLCACGDVMGVPNNVYGCGLIDVGAAVEAALVGR